MNLQKYRKTNKYRQHPQEEGEQQTCRSVVFFVGQGFDKFFHFSTFALRRQAICHDIKHCISACFGESIFPKRGIWGRFGRGGMARRGKWCDGGGHVMEG